MYIICTECLALQKNWMSRFAKIRWEIVYMYCTEFLDLQKNWISQTSKIQRKIVYIRYARNVRICRKVEWPELRKLYWKLCTLYVRNDWISRKIECPELHKFYRKFSTLYVRNVWIWRKIDCHSSANSVGNCVHYTYEMSEFVKNWQSKLRKFDGKLCALYMYGMSGFAEEIEYPELQKFNGKLYTLYM